MPNLRNVKFTGPYFHNGDSATLRQVVEFYTRGGNFPNTNFHDLDPDIEGIPGLRFPEFLPSSQRNMHDLIDFVSEGLTDPRVALRAGHRSTIRRSVRSERNERMPRPAWMTSWRSRPSDGTAAPRRSIPSSTCNPQTP